MEKANTMEVAETNKFWLKRKKANKLSFSFSYEDKWIALKKIHKVWDSSPYLSLTKYALPAYHISKKKIVEFIKAQLLNPARPGGSTRDPVDPVAGPVRV